MTMKECVSLQSTTSHSQQSSVADQHHASEETLASGQTGLYPQFVLFGDSITQRACLTIQPRLQDLYVRQADIINRGFSGYTSTLALATLPYFLPLPFSSSLEHQPSIRLITIFFGANDACLPGNAQHVALSDYVANLRRIVEYCLRVNNHMEVILITPPPVNEWQLTKPLTRTAVNTRRYALAARQLAAEMCLPCLDLWTILVSHVDDIPYSLCGGRQQQLNQQSANGNSISLHTTQTEAELHGYRDTSSSSCLASSIPGSLALPPSATLASFFLDGLHLTDRAYDIVFTELVDLIRAKTPQCASESMPWCFRPFREILDMPVATSSGQNTPHFNEKRKDDVNSEIEERAMHSNQLDRHDLKKRSDSDDEHDDVSTVIGNGWHKT